MVTFMSRTHFRAKHCVQQQAGCIIGASFPQSHYRQVDRNAR